MFKIDFDIFDVRTECGIARRQQSIKFIFIVDTNSMSEDIDGESNSQIVMFSGGDKT